MTLTTAKTAASWLLVTAMVVLFIAASWHLSQAVLHARVESVIAGGGLMFGAVMAAWFRSSLIALGGPQGHLQCRTDWMAEPA